MQYSRVLAGAVLLMLSTPALSRGQQTFTFSTNPFEGSTALVTAGRQIVGGEPSITFNIATDVFAFDGSVFGMGSSISFANGLVGSIPTSGMNVVVLQTFDNDANGGTPFGAGNAADLLASRITASGAGVFIYFNSGLDMPRLVYSTDLSDNTADLRILARLTNLTGQGGRDAIPQFTAANFAVVTTVPEPSSLLLLAAGLAVLITSGTLRARITPAAPTSQSSHLGLARSSEE